MIVRYALLLLAGGFAAQHSRVLPQWDPVLLLIVASICFYGLPRTRPIVVFATGALLFVLAAQSYGAARLDPYFEGDSMLTVVRVVDFPKRVDRTVTMVITPVHDSRLPERSRVSWFEPPVNPAIGDTWQFELRLRRPRGSSNPGGFDSEAWMLRENLHADGYVVAGKRNRLLESGRPNNLTGVRSGIVDAANRTQAPGVIAAITTGSRHALSREQWNHFAATGTSHLMAISGLHVGLSGTAAFLVVFLLVGVLRLPVNALRYAILGGAAFAAAYALISGFGVPAQRATLMLVLVAVTVCRGLVVSPPRILAAAALVVYLADPLASMTPGFHLSFGAVIVLFWFAQRLWRPDKPGGRPAIVIRQLISMQGVLLLGLMPLTALLFQRVSLVAPLVNLGAVPVFSFVTVPAALLGIVALPVDERLGDLAFTASAASVGWVEAWIAGFAVLELAVLTVARQSGFLVIVLWLPLLWVGLPRGWPGRGVAVLAATLVLTHKPSGPPLGCFDGHVLDVGQGLSVVIRTHRNSMLYDTGIAYRSGGTAAKQTVLPFLRFDGIDDIGWLIVSHSDLDHAGGVEDVLANILVNRVVWDESGAAPNGFRCRAGQAAWRVDGVSVRVLHPSSTEVSRRNDGSCVVEVSVGSRRLLLLGDIEERAESRLVANGSLRTASVVVVPHHGSLTSSSPALVNRLEADVAVVSAGYANRWGFPKMRVVKRWEGSGATVLNTAMSGSVSFRLCRWRHRTGVAEERAQRARFWRGETHP